MRSETVFRAPRVHDVPKTTFGHPKGETAHAAFEEAPELTGHLVLEASVVDIGEPASGLASGRDASRRVEQHESSRACSFIPMR